jgi:hypothetical protein
MGVQPDQAPLGVGERTAGGTPRQHRGVFDAPGHAPATRPPKGAIDGADEAKGDSSGPLPGRHCKDSISDAGRRIGPFDGRRVRGVDGENGEITVGVDPGHGALHGSAVGEGHLSGAVPQVVGVREHLAVADHHSGASTIAPDGHRRRLGLVDHTAGCR